MTLAAGRNAADELALGALIADAGWYSDHLEEPRDGSPPRIVRLLPEEFGDSVSSEYEIRLKRLCAQSLPFVVTTRGFGTATGGRPCVVRDRIGDPLDAVLPPGGEKPAVVEHWLETLLTGLESLHSEGIAHGGVSLQNILVADGSGRPSAWLANPVFGPITWWSEGKYHEEHAARYLPPEWKGQFQAPSPRADLYALGLVICEAYLGKGTLNGLTTWNGAATAWQQLRTKVRKRASKPVCKLLEALLEPDPMDRPADAAAALGLLEKSRSAANHWISRIIITVAAVVSVLVVAGAMLFGANQSRGLEELKQEVARLTSEHHKELDKHRSTIATLDSDLQRKVTELDTATAAMNQLTADLTALRGNHQKLCEEYQRATGKPGPGCMESPVTHIRTLWTKNLLPDKKIPRGNTSTALRPLIDELNALNDASKTAPPPHQEVLQGWHRRAYFLFKDIRGWLGVDSQVLDLYLSARARPWDEDATRKLRDRLDYLNLRKKAEAIWREWAEDEQKAWADVNDLIESGRKRGQREYEILSQWRDALVDRKSRGWTLRLKKGTAPDGWGTTRLVGVQEKNEEDAWIYSDVHEWSSPTAHSYPNAKSHEISFRWTPGSSTGIRLYGERSALTGGARRRLIIGDDHFKGPLALWLMHDRGRIEIDEFSLEFEIVNCPGPPRRKPTLEHLR